MLTIYHSNRQELLIARLAQITSQQRAHPFDAELIISQSPGMARWISIRLAEQLGIAANYDFPLPSSFFWNLFTSQFPELGSTSGYEKPVLTWRLMKLLPELIQQAPFAPLARYLSDEEDERRYYQLSRRVADVVDSYLIYRPEMVLAWENEPVGDNWQAILWRALVRDTGQRPHRAQLLQGFIDHCRAGKLDAAALPARLNFFGISTLPPAYLKLLQCLAQHTEVNLFLLNPCHYYWGDIKDPKQIARRRSKLVLSGQSEEDYLVHGNRLLASMGKQGQDYIDALIEEAPMEEELFHQTFADTLLGRMQFDILELDETVRDDGEADQSISLHSCHSPMREVEVLQDRLLELFNADPELHPDDVIIMTPDVESYAPYIEAVFGGASGEHYIPWTLSDRTPQGQHPVIRAFQQLLDVCSGRFEASEVLSLLESPAILARFNLSPADFERIRLWVDESGIRWGLNANSRSELSVNNDSHTWAFGLRRLLLGYALPADTPLYKGIAPYPHVEGQSALALGQLMQFIEALERLHGRLQGSYSAAGWAELLNQALETIFVHDDSSETALQWVRGALADLVEQQADADYDKRFGLAILRDHLNSSLNEALSDTQFLNGKLTFCTLLPMRSLPFRIIMMIGMNEAVFPRQNRPLGFDLIAQHPKPGDRSRREDDRYLFLEALLSARQMLYISYVGKDIRDNSPRLPSVLVSELLDYIEHCYGRATRQALITEHAMQPFSARNYMDSGQHYSYSADWLPGIKALHQQEQQPERLPEFIHRPLPVAAGTQTEIELEPLIQFFCHPARAFLQQRLGINFAFDAELLEDSEPFELDYLQGYTLKQQLLQAALDGDSAQSFALLKARGELPAAPFDALSFADLGSELEPLQEQIEPLYRDKQPDIEIDLPLAGIRLTGWLRNVYAQGLLRYRPANIKAQDRLRIWIEHLLFNSQGRSGPSHYVGRDGVMHLAAVANAEALLTELVALYQQGLQQPLHFYPQSSWAQVTDSNKVKGIWEGNSFMDIAGEGDDPYTELALRGQPALDEAFEQLARQIYAPLLAAMEVDDA